MRSPAYGLVLVLLNLYEVESLKQSRSAADTGETGLPFQI